MTFWHKEKQEADSTETSRLLLRAQQARTILKLKITRCIIIKKKIKMARKKDSVFMPGNEA